MSSAPPPGDPPGDQPAYPDPPQQPGYSPEPGYQGRPGSGSGTNGVAIGALVLGLLSVPLGFFIVGALFGLVAIVLGIIGVNRARGLGGTGKGMAITGIVSGALGVLIPILLAVGLVSFFGSEEGQQLIDEIEASVSELEGGG